MPWLLTHALPVRPDRGDRTGILVGGFKPFWKQCGYLRRISAVLQRNEIAGIMPWNWRNDRRLAGRGTRVEKALERGHGYSSI